MAKRGLVALTCVSLQFLGTGAPLLTLGLVAGCTSTLPETPPAPEPGPQPPTSPPAGKPDAQAPPGSKPDADPVSPPAPADAAPPTPSVDAPTAVDVPMAADASAPTPDVGTPGDAGVTPPPGDAGSGPLMPGVRTSLVPDLAAKWTGARKSIKDEMGSMVFTGVFEAGKFGGPQGHTVRLTLPPAREYIFEYRIRFDGSFPWTRGGKIPGLAGGNAPTGCVSVNPNGFSARMMWRGAGNLVGYLYDQDQSSACGNNVGTSFTFKANQWHTIKERVRINTGRNHDGILQIWADDRMVVDRKNIEYMAEAPANKINSILFHAFFGGSTQAWAPGRQCSMSFADPFITLVE